MNNCDCGFALSTASTSYIYYLLLYPFYLMDDFVIVAAIDFDTTTIADTNSYSALDYFHLQFFYALY